MVSVSIYRANHSTETAVLKELSDILPAIDAGDLSALMLLDLSVAFDVVDHDYFSNHDYFSKNNRRLQTSYGINGVVLQWFWVYLADRSQYVRVRSTTSTPGEIVCGVGYHRGSLLGPFLFLLYTADPLSLIEDHGLVSHLYAYDTQIYGFCSPSASLQLQNDISGCIDDVAAWMQVNTTKTEIWSTIGRRLQQLPQFPLRVGSNYIAPASVVRDLEIYLDSNVSMRSHVAKTFCLLRCAKSASECPSVTLKIRSPLADVVTSPVTSRLWQCNLGWHSEVSSQADAVSTKLGCVTRVFFVEVRPLHSTPPPTALAEST